MTQSAKYPPAIQMQCKQAKNRISVKYGIVALSNEPRMCPVSSEILSSSHFHSTHLPGRTESSSHRSRCVMFVTYVRVRYRLTPMILAIYLGKVLANPFVDNIYHETSLLSFDHTYTILICGLSARATLLIFQFAIQCVCTINCKLINKLFES